ncbi:hypothetical protein NEOLEDRAFT_1018930, partial [Neolentinus lepideus HHB14362 ss-1]
DNPWRPYANKAAFELADFLFTQEQMSAKKIDTLLGIWASSAAQYGADAPFRDARQLYKMI